MSIQDAPRPLKPEPPESKTETGRLVRVHKEISSGIEDITPDLAAAILERQTDNRPVSTARVAFYERQIEEGRWMVNGEAIVFDWFDRLIDGQHRLWAAFNSGKKIRTIVVRGVDPASFVTIDTGKARDAKDLLAIRGEANSVVLAGVLRLVWRWELFERYRGVLYTRKSVRKTSDKDESPIGKRWGTALVASPRELDELLTRHPNVRTWVRKSKNKVVPQVPMAFASYWIASIGALEEDVNAFCTLLADGAGMAKDDPIFRLHKRFVETKIRAKGRRRVDTIESVALIVKAWNAARRGRKTEMTIWRSDEDMPEPILK